MARSYFISFLLLFSLQNLFAQDSKTGVGIGIYPTGTETGLGFRSSKNARLVADVRIAKANFYTNESLSSFITEVSAVYKVVKLEKVRFHIGIGERTEWNFGSKNNKYGVVVPVGVEAFPFPFQNAGLFFEVAPFLTHDFVSETSGGIRTVAGFIFYFPVKDNPQITH